MAFYREGKSERDFDAGIGKALSAVLINPEFLFRVEVDPDKTAAGAAYRISDLELASRLSFFLWSSLPDDALLDSAIRGELRRPDVLDRHVRRMLADPRWYNLASNFAGQWLRLRNVTSVDPNVRLYPDFDDNLRQAFRLETELFVDSVVREDRSVLDLLRADYTFLNERLAKHYGIPNVYGSRFRRVELGRDSRRGGLLRQGSILAVSSYATRTSPVLRGVWVLSNIVGAPPPPPLPNVPALDGNVPANLPVRERMAAHRASPVCASCHRTIDPVGFTLENFDAVGRWRDNEGDSGPIDVSGTLPGLGDVNGVAGLEEALLRRPELFAATLTEKLLTFALGRGVEVLRCASGAEDSSRGPARWLPLLVAHSGNRQQCAVSDEEIVMIITKKALPRRTFLKGVQATLALPLLDAMIPAVTALAKTPAKPVSRLGFVFIPMGCDRARWTPLDDGGVLNELSQILAPLEPVKEQLTVVTNLRLEQSYPGTHDTSNAGFLSAAFAKHTESSDYHLGTTVDQIAAKQMGRDRQLPSLELAMDLNPLAGVCNNGYACVYQNCLSWSSPTTPLPSEAHPRIVFERLFGEGDSADGRRTALRNRSSLLDSFSDDIARLKRKVGATDRVRVDQYFDTVREVERQIQRAEAGAANNPMPDADRPVGVPAAFADHARLMFDLQVLAFQADITRVVTFQLARELSNRTYPEIGVPEPHHPTSHHGNNPEKLAAIAKINTFHVSLFAEFLEKLKSTPDGDGSLLDNTVYLYGSGMGNSSLHDHENLPILVAGGAACGMRGGRHIQYKEGTPLANLHLTLLDRVGVHQDSFGDSKGKIDELFDPVSL